MKISVILPIYNGERFLKCVLNSLINQTYQDLEIICVNDGSTDKTADILAEYADKDARIKIITQENQGLSGARNTGMEAMTGDYFTFIDADDYLMLTAYEKCVKAINESDADIIVFNGMTYSEEIGLSYYFIKLYETSEWGSLKQSHIKSVFDHSSPLRCPFAAWDKLFKTSWYKQHNFKFMKGMLAQDRLFSAQAYLATDKVYVLNDYLYCYRQQENSITAKYNEKNAFDVFTIFDVVKQEYEKKGLFKQYNKSFLEYLIRETLLVVNHSDEELHQKILEESAKRLSELEKEPQYIEICDDIMSQDRAMFLQKYRNIGFVINK